MVVVSLILMVKIAWTTVLSLKTPPLEWKNSLTWDNETLSAGVLWRLVSAQKRYATGQGNIIGQDIGASAGFGRYPLILGGKLINMPLCRVELMNVI